MDRPRRILTALGDGALALRLNLWPIVNASVEGIVFQNSHLSRQVEPIAGVLSQ
jgi:hypothetical protein